MVGEPQPRMIPDTEQLICRAAAGEAGLVQRKVAGLAPASTTKNERKSGWLKRLVDCIAPWHAHAHGLVLCRKGFRPPSKVCHCLWPRLGAAPIIIPAPWAYIPEHPLSLAHSSPWGGATPDGQGTSRPHDTDAQRDSRACGFGGWR